MIKNGIVIINNREYKRTYSSKGCYIEREGIYYSEAFDPAESEREYNETNKKIEEA